MYSIGFAKDIHLLKPIKSSIKLGGYLFKSKYKIIATSDGDIILHAISNAILGSIQQNDIGVKFSDLDPKNKNLDSKIILSYVLSLIKKQKIKIQNIDVMIICDKIIINPIREKIKLNLIKLINTKKINIKATRFEQNKSIIEVDAIVLVKKG